MSTVTVTQTESGSATTDIIGKVVYGTDFYKQRLNHYNIDIVDGSNKIYDEGPYKLYGLILMKDISLSDKQAFLDWLEDDVILDTYRFTISALANVDWGLGTNTAVTNCRYAGGASTKEIFEYMPPGKYTFSFKYMAEIS